MIRPNASGGNSLATFSIIVAQAKVDPEIREAILADGSFKAIWPLVAERDATPQNLSPGSASGPSKAHTDDVSDESTDQDRKEKMGMTGKSGGWKEYLASPQFYIITATVAVLLCGAGAYSRLDGKIDSVRIEAKSDIQAAEQRISSRIDKVDARFDRLDTKLDSKFDRLDSRFDAVLNKLDNPGKSRELSHPTVPSKG